MSDLLVPTLHPCHSTSTRLVAGLLKVLQQLLSLQPGMPVSGFLYLRIITATLHTYMLLSRAAAAIGSFETAAHLLEEGLLLGMQLPEKSRWMCLQPVLKELRVHLVHAEEMKPYNRAVPLLYWQLVVKHKVRTGVVYCAHNLGASCSSKQCSDCGHQNLCSRALTTTSK
jgi:hypothetical protein